MRKKGLKDSNMLKIGKAICHKCGDSAKFNCGGKWYCAYTTEMGNFNLVGYCKNEKERKNKTNSNT